MVRAPKQTVSQVHVFVVRAATQTAQSKRANASNLDRRVEDVLKVSIWRCVESIA
jgi:hypothetical protein